MQVTAAKRTKRPPKQVKEEPLYLWLPIALLAKDDLIVVNQQEVCVLVILHQDDEWHVRLLNPETREKREESYRNHHFVYTKSTASVKARLAHQSSVQGNQAKAEC